VALSFFRKQLPANCAPFEPSGPLGYDHATPVQFRVLCSLWKSGQWRYSWPSRHVSTYHTAIQAARPSWNQHVFQDKNLCLTAQLRQLTCCTPATGDIDSVEVLSSTDNVVCEASAGSVRNSIVVVRAKYTGAALDHVCRSVYGLRVQLSGIVEESSLGVFVTMAVILNVSI